MLAALSMSASVRQIVPQAAEATSANAYPETVPSTDVSVHKAATPVAPYKRVEALLPIVRDPGIREEHQKIASMVLRALIPSRCIGDLKNFYISYADMKSRGYAGKDTIIVSGKLSDKELIGILVHETTHFLDLSGCTGGTLDSGASAFKDGNDKIYNDDPSVSFYSLSWAAANIQKKGMADAAFVTGYAKHNCFEDIAETVAYYVLHQDDFRKRATKNRVLAKKLEWVETYIFPGGRSLATQEGPAFSGKIPWDATKLAFSWKDKDERLAAR